MLFPVDWWTVADATKDVVRSPSASNSAGDLQPGRVRKWAAQLTWKIVESADASKGVGLQCEIWWPDCGVSKDLKSSGMLDRVDW